MLHVNGSLQIVNELNVRGNASTPGSPGTDGQFLISKGPGIAPQWTSVSIPALDVGAYKLKGVYQFNLNDVYTNTNGNYLTLGNFNNVNVSSPNNLIVVEFQSSTSVISFLAGDGMSYQYRLSGNNGIVSSLSPFFYILSTGFNPMNNLTSYKFFYTNVTPNTYNLILEAYRSNTIGSASSKYINFNRTYSTSSSFVTDGKAMVYVYEQ
ncbi:hypothetical protein [Chryseobacterium sp. AG844]|uniref:hypothetical protein n=1 Tax=Chryseobacterium sp. AG844 TaxID=2183998 RepID=UPI0011B23295|nr:hypothetical protein [Chryseobacterium sp. AG844]